MSVLCGGRAGTGASPPHRQPSVTSEPMGASAGRIGRQTRPPGDLVRAPDRLYIVHRAVARRRQVHTAVARPPTGAARCCAVFLLLCWRIWYYSVVTFIRRASWSSRVYAWARAWECFRSIGTNDEIGDAFSSFVLVPLATLSLRWLLRHVLFWSYCAGNAISRVAVVELTWETVYFTGATVCPL